MNNEMNSFKKALGVNWIKSELGMTYLCPATIGNLESRSDSELRELCVEESLNPQND